MTDIDCAPPVHAPLTEDPRRDLVASPTLARRRLALELRRLREQAGRPGDRVAAALRWSPSKISRAELARIALAPDDVDKLLAYYRVTGPLHDELIQLAHTAREPCWWDAYTSDIPAHLHEVIGLEHAAASIWIRCVAARDGGLRIPGAMGRLRAGASCRDAAAGELRGDDLLVVAAGDLDAAGLGRLVDPGSQGQHAGGVVRGDLAGLEGLADGLNMAGIRRVLERQEETRQLEAGLARLQALAGDRAADRDTARPPAGRRAESPPRPD